MAEIDQLVRTGRTRSGGSGRRIWLGRTRSIEGEGVFFSDAHDTGMGHGGAAHRWSSPECDALNKVDEALAKPDEGLMAELVGGFSSVLGEQRAPAAIYGDGDHCSSRRGSYTMREGKLEGG